MVPHVDRPEDVPYYHPVLRKLAFKYSSEIRGPSSGDAPEAGGPSDDTTNPAGPEVKGTISISILPFPADPSSDLSQDQSSTTSILASQNAEQVESSSASSVLPNRTYRTCLHLLETLHKHGWGRITGYQKRVVHDVRFKLHIIRFYVIPSSWWSSLLN